ncbi:hypothetical protein CLV92_102262 [Kineococcus xinjiangensis]|uniref:Lipoprotein n=1 Tax=Kineococcus xinjiangensis TaxID=512762 RepID=A0A2S6IV92_9ACTN|nr:hypothetical protein CLV92_102262 [Kineococcus xinjiangensis]
MERTPQQIVRARAAAALLVLAVASACAWAAWSAVHGTADAGIFSAAVVLACGGPGGTPRHRKGRRSGS